MYKLTAILFILTQISWAQSSPDWCWLNEENPATKQPYSSFDEWDKDPQLWKLEFHSQLNVIQLVKAFQVYKTEKAKADSFGNDKMAHCYVGCRISQKINFKTSRFLAWLKEEQDLTDCKRESHFEWNDYKATILGAEVGKNKETNCESVCPPLVEKLGM